MDNNKFHKKAENGSELENQKLKSKFYGRCPICGSIYYIAGHEARHKKSKKHLMANYINNEMFEIVRKTQ